MTNDHHIDKEFIIYIFTPDFISSFINIILIKNGRGNRPADAVAAGFDLSGRRVLNPAFLILGGKDEMKTKLLYLFISLIEVF